MLLDECQKVDVEIQSHCEVSNLQSLAEGAGYELQLSQLGVEQIHRCSSLVVATGALSIPTLGGSDFGYDIARQFGLDLVERRAGLVPLMFSDATKEMCGRLSGLALEVEVTCNGESFTENMLFTHRGISGPVILQISNYWQPGDSVTVDLLPGVDAAEVFIAAKNSQRSMHLKTLLGHSLAKSLASASEGYRTAEVTLGGVSTDAISSKTMEARKQKGLFFIGEVLDVSGHLGGFNFQWAWSSGYSAGLVA